MGSSEKYTHRPVVRRLLRHHHHQVDHGGQVQLQQLDTTTTTSQIQWCWCHRRRHSCCCFNVACSSSLPALPASNVYVGSFMALLSLSRSLIYQWESLKSKLIPTILLDQSDLCTKIIESLIY